MHYNVNKHVTDVHWNHSIRAQLECSSNVQKTNASTSSCLRAFWLMKAVSRWLDTLLVIDLLAHFLQLQHAVQVIRSCTCNACVCMHLGNPSASLEVNNPHLETSCAPFGFCRASCKGRRAFRRIRVPARPHDGRFGGWAGQLRFLCRASKSNTRYQIKLNYPKLDSNFV